jgi:hypothetical protein
MHSKRSLIFLARWLGYAGALPFLALGLLVLWPEFIGPEFIRLQISSTMRFSEASIAFALLSYGAIILSFLGGLHWGRAVTIPSDQQIISMRIALLWSVSLSLIAWFALILQVMFFPMRYAASLLIAGFAAALIADLKLLEKGYWPAWMRTLRLHLSLTAMASLLALSI